MIHWCLPSKYIQNSTPFTTSTVPILVQSTAVSLLDHFNSLLTQLRVPVITQVRSCHSCALSSSVASYLTQSLQRQTCPYLIWLPVTSLIYLLLLLPLNHPISASMLFTDINMTTRLPDPRAFALVLSVWRVLLLYVTM